MKDRELRVSDLEAYIEWRERYIGIQPDINASVLKQFLDWLQANDVSRAKENKGITIPEDSVFMDDFTKRRAEILNQYGIYYAYGSKVNPMTLAKAAQALDALYAEAFLELITQAWVELLEGESIDTYRDILRQRVQETFRKEKP